MSLPPDYWPQLAEDYQAAYQAAFPTPGGAAEALPSRNAILLAMSVAEHETANGRDWPGQWNFGAVQLRPLTLQEAESFTRGLLKAGDYTPSRDGCLRVDTHPGPSGPVPYPMWFAAFPDRVSGIAHFLRVLWRLSSLEPDSVSATPFSLAAAMYLHGYYEGAHHGARPPSQRAYPLNVAEQSNVTDYANAIAHCMSYIAPALAAWGYGRDEAAGVDGVTTDPREAPTTPLLIHVADTEPPPPDDVA